MYINFTGFTYATVRIADKPVVDSSGVRRDYGHQYFFSPGRERRGRRRYKDNNMGLRISYSLLFGTYAIGKRWIYKNVKCCIESGFADS